MYFRKRSKEEMKDAIAVIRLDLYNRDFPCGAKAIQERMRELGEPILPSGSVINRALDEKFLTHRRTGFYEGDYPRWVLQMMEKKGIRTSSGLRKLLSVHPESKNLKCVESFGKGGKSY